MMAVVTSLWHFGRLRAALLDQIAEEIQYHQRRRAQARQSHATTTCATLRALGIQVDELPRCEWGAT